MNVFPRENDRTGSELRRDRLKWHGHVERKDDADCVRACGLMVEGAPPVGRPNMNTVSVDMRLLRVDRQMSKTE